jgi:cytochrome c biogenesis protein CcmG/thiol:disulfide interchange protein DsbE
MEINPDVPSTTTANSNRSLPRWVIALAFAILLGFLALIAWGLRVSQGGPITIGQKVPGFSLTTFDGQTYNTAQLSGKVVLVNFWASWCQPCSQEAAALETAWQAYQPGGQVVFLGEDYVDTEPEARAYLKQYNVSYPNGPDLRTQVSQLFHIRGVPETYILNKQGKLAYVKIGPFASADEIKTVVDGLLK